MLRGEPVALLVTALFAGVLAAERVPKLRSLRAWPVLAEIFPVLAVLLAAHSAAHWFTSVSAFRSPQFVPTLIACAAFALPTAAVRNPRARRIVAGVSIVLLSFLALADAVYIRFFGGIIPLMGSANVKQAWDVTSSIISLGMLHDLWFVVLMAVGVWVAATRPDVPAEGRRRLRTFAFGGALAVAAAGVLFVVLDVRAWLEHGVSVRIFSWRQRLHETGLYGGHVRDVARTVRDRRQESEPPSPEKIRALSKYLEGTRDGAPTELYAVAKGKNLIVLQLEALQQWVIDARVRGTEITPFLNQLRRDRALYFSGVWDQTAISPTADSEFLTLNSQHPLPDAAVVFRFSDNDFVALPGVLARQGYSTMSAHAFDRGFWNRATIHPRYGFQQSYFDRELGREPKIGWGLSDKIFLARALERVDRMRPPFMAFCITLSSHHPYMYLPREERHIDTTGLPEVVGDYVASMRYVDEALSGFFAALAKRPYAKDTVVALYGDHEARIPLDRAGIEQSLRVLSLDKQTMKDVGERTFATRKVPLFIVLPDAKEGRTFDRVGGQIDISPTILHLLGLPKPNSMIGRPLIGTGGAVFRTDGSAVEGERVRLSDGNCRTLSGQGLPATACDDLGRRGEEQLKVSWAITQHNLSERLAGERRAAR
jgi:phosphoglycerol transferase MdoB-like AlkP superfamily enzyme